MIDYDTLFDQTLDNCFLYPYSLKKAEIIREWAGLRPCRRNGVRLEADEVKIASRNIPVCIFVNYASSTET